jgi:hypothetical protein
MDGSCSWTTGSGERYRDPGPIRSGQGCGVPVAPGRPAGSGEGSCAIQVRTRMACSAWLGLLDLVRGTVILCQSGPDKDGV